MGSPKLTKVSMFAQSAYLTSNTSTGGVAYQTTNDGDESPINAPVTADGMRSGRQGMLAENAETVIKGYELSFAKALRTHGEERWFRDAVSTHEANPTVVSPATTPPTYDKVYKTDVVGPDGAYTFVVDRFGFQDGGVSQLYPAVYADCVSKGWSLEVSEGNPVNLTQDFVARTLTDGAASATATTAAYAAATVGQVRPYAWKDAVLKLGAADSVPSTAVGFLRSFSYTQDNQLDVDRYYIQGNSLMSQPYSQDDITGTISMEFDYADTIETAIWNRWKADTHIAVQLELTRDPYQVILYIPNVMLGEPSRVASKAGATKLSVSGDAKWNGTDDMVKLTIRTEGATNA